MVSIDDFVFNHYPDTKIDFFMDPPGESAIGKENDKESILIWGSKGDGSGGLYGTINQWYSVFRMLAIIVYMIMIIYMGIRVMLSSTGDNLAQYKTLFMYWVTGVVILFFYPFVMKYAIKMNSAFVKTVEESKNSILVGIDTGKPANIKNENVDSMETLDFTESPFEGGTDYMSQIAKDAVETKRFALALTYIILTWQLLTLALHYYKRIMMVGFLICIFPIVMTFYVLDKIGDGKSQSFNKWNKEFIVNVFIQSFHAIIYVFVVGTVYAAKDSSGSYDYVLLITGATFLFTGEDIIKKIFSQESQAGTMSSLTQTAAATMATVGAVKAAGKLVTAPVTNGIKGIQNISRTNAEAKNADAKLNVADKLGLFTATSAPNSGLRLDSAQAEMARIDADTSLTDAQKTAQKAEVTRVANAVATVNNPNSRSAEEMADALNTLRNAKGTQIGDAIMGSSGSKLTTDQIDDLTAIQNEVAGMVANGVTNTVDIDRHLKMRLEFTLAGLPGEEQEKYRRMILADMMVRGAARYANPATSAHDEVQETLRELSNVTGSFNLAATSADMTQLERDADSFARSLLQDGEDLTDEDKALAVSILAVNKRGAGVLSAEQCMEYLDNIIENDSDSEVAKKLRDTMAVDPSILRHSLASKIAGDSSIAEDDPLKVKSKELMARMAGGESREGYFDDEVSAHELIDAMSIEDENARNDKIRELEEAIARARVESNAAEREATQAIAADLLAQESARAGHDVLTEGSLDTTTEYFEGKTREEMLKERRNARRNAVLSYIGEDRDINKGYSEEYIRNQQARTKHFYGDHPTE